MMVANASSRATSILRAARRAPFVLEVRSKLVHTGAASFEEKKEEHHEEFPGGEFARSGCLWKKIQLFGLLGGGLILGQFEDVVFADSREASDEDGPFPGLEAKVADFGHYHNDWSELQSMVAQAHENVKKKLEWAKSFDGKKGLGEASQKEKRELKRFLEAARKGWPRISQFVNEMVTESRVDVRKLVQMAQATSCFKNFTTIEEVATMYKDEVANLEVKARKQKLSPEEMIMLEGAKKVIIPMVDEILIVEHRSVPQMQEISKMLGELARITKQWDRIWQ